jgi:glycosyltransferase involved in cell wall biosynthesis
MNSPRVAIVIPVLNEEKILLKSLELFCGQSFPKNRFKLFIVDNDSTDNTREIIEIFRIKHTDINISLLSEYRKGIKFATSTGFYHALDSDIIIKLDADTLIKNTFIEDVVQIFIQQNVGAIIGELVFSWSLFIEMDSDMRRQYARLIKNRIFLRSILDYFYGPILNGPFYAIKSEVYKKIGGINLRNNILKYNDDVELGMRLLISGYKIFRSDIKVTISDRRLKENGLKYLTNEYYWGAIVPQFLHRNNKLEKFNDFSYEKIIKNMIRIYSDLLLRFTSFSLAKSKKYKPHERFIQKLKLNIPYNIKQNYPSSVYYYLKSQSDIINNYLYESINKFDVSDRQYEYSFYHQK